MLRTFSKAKTILTSFSCRECWAFFVSLSRDLRLSTFKPGREKSHRLLCVIIRPRKEWNRVCSFPAYMVTFVLIVYNTCHRKTTIILFKNLGIERAWKARGSVGPRPRQIFITKSRRLANKVEEEYVDLLVSLCKGIDLPEDVQEHIKRWNKRKKMDTFDPDNNEDDRNDLPPRYSQLHDEHFPLFITTDTVSIIFISHEREQKLMWCISYSSRIALQPSRGRYKS